MKSFATGLSVRFFRVTMPTGTRVIGSVTGKTLSSDDERRLHEAAAVIGKETVARKGGRDAIRQALLRVGLGEAAAPPPPEA